MNTAEVIDRLRDNPRQIRVLCPRGDFIANITLSVRDGDLAMRLMRTEKSLRDLASRQQPPYMPTFTWQRTRTLCWYAPGASFVIAATSTSRHLP